MPAEKIKTNIQNLLFFNISELNPQVFFDARTSHYKNAKPKRLPNLTFFTALSN